MNGEGSLRVTVDYRGLKVEFAGSPESVMASVNSFLIKNIPNLDLASRITVNYSVTDLINGFEDHVKLTPEGPRVWVGEKKLSDKDTVGLALVAARIGQQTQRRQSDSLALTEIQASTGLKSKSISSRLSEMFKAGYVEREAHEDGVRYRITTQGIQWLKTALVKKAGKVSLRL